HRAGRLSGPDQPVPGRAGRARAGAAVSRGARVSGRAAGRAAESGRGGGGVRLAGGLARGDGRAGGRGLAPRAAGLRSVRGMRVGRHLRLAAAQLKISTQAALEYRVGFWTTGLVNVLWSLGGVVPLIIALDHRPDVAGWSPWQVALLTGFYLVFSGIYA